MINIKMNRIESVAFMFVCFRLSLYLKYREGLLIE